MEKIFDIEKTEALTKIIETIGLDLTAYVVHDEGGIFVARLYGPDEVPDTIQEYDYVKQLLEECEEHLETNNMNPEDYFWGNLAPHQHDLKWWNENVK